MSAEFIATMGDNGGMYSTFEYDVTRYVAGEVETVRARLADALEQMGYRVLNDNPIQARRGSKGLAASGCSQDILDYQTTLNIGVKSVGGNSTRVTLDYAIKGPYGGWFLNGDRKTLTREAEAILALAMAKAAAHCPACGADTAGSSRFCRQCGSPLSLAMPAEIEVLRLTANANAGYKNISGGLFFLLLAGLGLLLLLLGSDDPVKFAKLLKAITIISGTIGAAGLWMLLLGTWRLRKTLKQPIEQDAHQPPPRRGALESVPDTNELPPASASHSVTEATTDLLQHEIKRAG